MKSFHKTNVLFEKSRFMPYNGIGNKKLKQNQIPRCKYGWRWE